MAEDLVDARVSTYSTLWPHEAKKGWKPKVKKVHTKTLQQDTLRKSS